MRFRIEQSFPAGRDTVLAALTDPTYLHALGELPDVGAPVLRRQDRAPDGSSVVQELEFAFRGHLPMPVTRVVDAHRLSWVEHTEVDLLTATARFRMVPVHYARFFTCHGSWVLEERGTDATTRVIDGDLKVHSPVPFVGGQVERAIVSGLRERLAHEPAVFARWQAGG